MLCLKFEFAKAITKRLTVFAIFSLTFCHAIFLLIAKGERFQHLRDSLEMKRIQQPWKTIRSALNQNTTYDSCNSMEDVWTATIMFMKPLGFVYCPIMKNMHSQMLALLGRIGHNRKKLRVDIPGELADAWATIHYPNNENVTYGVFGKDVINTVNGSKKVEILAIIRDPFDRFISAHGNMCIAGKICNDSLTGFCEDNFECMLAHLLKMSKYCTWREFSESSLAIHHFVPQAYYCYLRKLKPYTNLVVYNNTAAFRSGLRQFLITRGVPKSEINRGWGENNGPWLETASFHNTRGVSRDVRKKIFSNITLLKTIYEIYKVDFEMFSFEMPPVVCQYCRNPKNFAENICAK